MCGLTDFPPSKKAKQLAKWFWVSVVLLVLGFILCCFHPNPFVLILLFVDLIALGLIMWQLSYSFIILLMFMKIMILVGEVWLLIDAFQRPQQKYDKEGQRQNIGWAVFSSQGWKLFWTYNIAAIGYMILIAEALLRLTISTFLYLDYRKEKKLALEYLNETNPLIGGNNNPSNSTMFEKKK